MYRLHRVPYRKAAIGVARLRDITITATIEPKNSFLSLFLSSDKTENRTFSRPNDLGPRSNPPSQKLQHGWIDAIRPLALK